jgi:hypothetical protein
MTDKPANELTDEIEVTSEMIEADTDVKASSIPKRTRNANRS